MYSIPHIQNLPLFPSGDHLLCFCPLSHSLDHPELRGLLQGLSDVRVRGQEDNLRAADKDCLHGINLQVIMTGEIGEKDINEGWFFPAGS